MDSATFQFDTDQYERLIWDAGIDTTAKTVALAIGFHLNHKTRSCNPSIPKLAKMCRCDERTVKRCIKIIKRVLGIEVELADGKSNTFKLRIFETADEIARMLVQEEWKRSYWLVFKKTELEEMVSQFRSALSPSEPASPNVPPALDVPPALGAVDPPQWVQQPPSLDVPRTSINLLRTSFTADAANGALNGKAHQPKKTRSPGSRKKQPAAYAEDFEEFWTAYRALMERAGGKAKENRNNMSKPATNTAWLALSDGDRRLARAVLPEYSRSAGQGMKHANNYLALGIFRNFAEDATRKSDGKLKLIAEYLMNQRQWDRDMIGSFGPPPGHPDCSLADDVIKGARAIAELSQNAARGGHA